jgi:hypothetical protein
LIIWWRPEKLENVIILKNLKRANKELNWEFLKESLRWRESKEKDHAGDNTGWKIFQSDELEINCHQLAVKIFYFICPESWEPEIWKMIDQRQWKVPIST